MTDLNAFERDITRCAPFAPGQELDALVAERVMGWTDRIEIAPGRFFKSAEKAAAEHGWSPAFRKAVQPSGFQYSRYLRVIHWTSDGEKLDWHKEVYRTPRYSTVIREAWHVAEKLGLAVIPQSMDDGFHWLAMDLANVLYTDTVTLTPRGQAFFSSDTVSHAICMAAVASFLSSGEGVGE